MGRYTFAMRRHTSRLVFLGLVTAVCACAPMPDGGQTFQGMQAEQAAIQSILNQGTSGTAATWQDPDGVQGTVTITGSPDADGCRTVETQGPRGQNTDRWCPTAHAFGSIPMNGFIAMPRDTRPMAVPYVRVKPIPAPHHGRMYTNQGLVRSIACGCFARNGDYQTTAVQVPPAPKTAHTIPVCIEVISPV